MKYWLIILLSLVSCSHWQIQSAGEHLLLQNQNKQLSCYTGSANNSSNCCYPYKAKLMICTYAYFNNFGNEAGAIVIRLVPEN